MVERVPPIAAHRMVVDKLRDRFRKRLLLFNAGIEYPDLETDVDLLLEDVGFAAPKTLTVDVAARRERSRAYQRGWYRRKNGLDEQTGLPA